MGMWLLLIQLAVPPSSPSCAPASVQALDTAQASWRRGDDAAVSLQLQSLEGNKVCDAAELARLAWEGWTKARALAPLGGAVEHMGPVQRTLATLERFRGTSVTLELEYADTCIRAAIAAAQDERPEMELLLTHARDLAERLQLRERRGEWPLPFNFVAGELWFEVDRYQDALMAYERAVRAGESPRALVGLARAQARLGRLEAACATFARVSDMAVALRQLAAPDLAKCR